MFLSTWLALIIASWLPYARAVVQRTVSYESSDITYLPNRGNWTQVTTATGLCSVGYSESSLEWFCSVSLQFVGVSIYVDMVRSINGTKVDIELDGVVVQTVDMYMSTVDCGTPIFQKTGLPYGTHKINIVDKADLPRFMRLEAFRYDTYTQDELASSASMASQSMSSIASQSSASVASASRASLSAVASASAAAASASAAQAEASRAADVAETKSRNGAIAGGIVGGIAVILIAIGVIWYILRHQRLQRQQQQDGEVWDHQGTKPIDDNHTYQGPWYGGGGGTWSPQPGMPYQPTVPYIGTNSTGSHTYAGSPPPPASDSQNFSRATSAVYSPADIQSIAEAVAEAMRRNPSTAALPAQTAPALAPLGQDVNQTQTETRASPAPAYDGVQHPGSPNRGYE